MPKKGTRRICPEGHVFYKSSDCPTCPTCEENAKPTDGFLSLIAAPAQRALKNAGINSLERLARFSEEEILSLHGMGPASLPALKSALKKGKLSFRE